MIDGIFKDTMVNMKWMDIQNYVEKNAVVLLPLGVIEEHVFFARTFCNEMQCKSVTPQIVFTC